MNEDDTVLLPTRMNGSDTSGIVKGFGCRPHTAMPRTPAAGVRKPPREETAIGEGGAVPRGRYGDLSATAVGANGA